MVNKDYQKSIKSSGLALELNIRLYSSFITLTRWTVAIALEWWQHNKTS